MRIFLLAAGLAIAVFSCKKSNNSCAPLIPDGTYKGTFQRETATGGSSSTVSITVSGNNWTGKSETPEYPALCAGSFKLSGKSIDFQNACIWTADFDWSLILNGSYNFFIKGRELKIWRDYNGANRDVYQLMRN
jgi:hypothetical protein